MNPFTVITLGEFISPKGTELAVRAFANFYHEITSKHQRRVQFCVIEEQMNNEKLNDLCKKEGLSKVTKILNLNQQTEIETTYQKGALFLFPVEKKMEAIIQESLSYGLPIVSFHNTDYEEYIDQTCGMLLKPQRDEDSIIEFSRKLSLLYFDPAARKLLSKGALKKHEECFTWGHEKKNARLNA